MDKTTVRINQNLKRDIDIRVAQEGITFQQVLNMALRQYLIGVKRLQNKVKKNWVDSLTPLNLGEEKYPLSRKNIYTQDEHLT